MNAMNAMNVSIQIEFMTQDEFQDEFFGQRPLMVEEEQEEEELGPMPKKTNDEDGRICCVIN